MKAKVYYAHAMCIYGHLTEIQELGTIRRRFKGRIVNPAAYSGHPEKRSDTLGFCFRLIEGCDVVVFTRCLGKITAGVGKEINFSFKLKKRVYELDGNKWTRRVKPVKHLTRRLTIRLYAKWRAKYLG